jgi:hypothetical protein
MDYQYLTYDGFIYRRPVPEWPHDISQMEIWNGKTWTKPGTVDIAMQPLYYGMEMTAADAQAQTGEAETA